MTIFDVDIARLTGSTAEMDRYRGSVVPVVNVASRCGTTPKDERLVAVVEKLLPR